MISRTRSTEVTLLPCYCQASHAGEGAHCEEEIGNSCAVFGRVFAGIGRIVEVLCYDQLAVVPFNSTATTISATKPGADAEYLDIKQPRWSTGPLKSTRVITGNVKRSKEASNELGRDVAIWDMYSCTDKPDFDCGADQTPLSSTIDLVAFDRTTGLAVDWEGSTSVSGGEIIKPEGFEGQYFKFPFDTQKRSYQFWDGTMNRATTAEFVGEGEVDGLAVYKFRQTIEPTKSGTIDVPGDLVGEDANTVTADRMYANVRTFSVEPTTGVILIGGEQQDCYLAVGGERKLTTTKATLGYTDETRRTSSTTIRARHSYWGS